MKKGLGRGFESLIPTTLIDESFDPTASQDGKVSRLHELATSDVLPDPDQPRRYFDERALAELAASVREHGIVQPIVVTPQGKKYLIVAGERRWRAAKLAELETVPAIVRTLTGQHRLEISLIENLQRRDLNPIETATAYLKLRDQFNMTLEQIGARVGGKSVSGVSNTLRLLKLPKSVKEAVFVGELSEGQARPMIGLPHEVAEELAEKVKKEDWSTRKIEQWIALWKQSKDQQPNQQTSDDQPHSRALEQLSEKFGSPVSIRTNTKGAGKIVIAFKDEADFERIRKIVG